MYSLRMYDIRGHVSELNESKMIRCLFIELSANRIELIIWLRILLVDKKKKKKANLTYIVLAVSIFVVILERNRYILFDLKYQTNKQKLALFI